MIVVGANHANIGEILNNTGNPTFEVGNDQSLKAAIEKLPQLKNEKQGQKNRQLALREWNILKISKQYIDVFKQVVKNK